MRGWNNHNYLWCKSSFHILLLLGMVGGYPLPFYSGLPTGWCLIHLLHISDVSSWFNYVKNACKNDILSFWDCCCFWLDVAKQMTFSLWVLLAVQHQSSDVGVIAKHSRKWLDTWSMSHGWHGKPVVLCSQVCGACVFGWTDLISNSGGGAGSLYTLQ